MRFNLKLYLKTVEFAFFKSEGTPARLSPKRFFINLFIFLFWPLWQLSMRIAYMLDNLVYPDYQAQEVEEPSETLLSHRNGDRPAGVHRGHTADQAVRGGHGHTADHVVPGVGGLKKLAVAVECFHKASLIHDDIEDGDDLRYGTKTLHVEYGVPVALNVGDFLLGEGYRLITELDVDLESSEQLLNIRTQLLTGVSPQRLIEVALEVLRLVLDGTHQERRSSQKFLDNINSDLATLHFRRVDLLAHG